MAGGRDPRASGVLCCGDDRGCYLVASADDAARDAWACHLGVPNSWRRSCTSRRLGWRPHCRCPRLERTALRSGSCPLRRPPSHLPASHSATVAAALLAIMDKRGYLHAQIYPCLSTKDVVDVGHESLDSRAGAHALRNAGTRRTSSVYSVGEFAPAKRRVRVWFGEHPIFDYTSLPAAAERYEHAMRRRFVGLRVTNEPVGE